MPYGTNQTGPPPGGEVPPNRPRGKRTRKGKKKAAAAAKLPKGKSKPKARGKRIR